MGKQPTIERLKVAFSTSRSLTELAFHLGYQQIYAPKLLRRLLGKTVIHKAWHSGYFGAGILGVLDRKISKKD